MGGEPKYYYPQLDSIRGLSFLAVYFFHAFHPQFDAGVAGRMLQFFYNSLALSIDVFFILSSFLLTWLGINEYKAKGDFSFINYFIRRALRIWPLYFILMLFAFVILPYVSERVHIPVTLPPAYYYLFFISNFYLEGHVYFLRFLWTLAVEEQFYLVWGFCLWLFQKYIKSIAAFMMVVSMVFTGYAVIHRLPHDLHTLTYLFDFATGILAAWLLYKGSSVVTWLKDIGRRGSLLFLLALPVLLVLMFFLMEFGPVKIMPWADLATRYLFIIYTGLLIIEQMINERALLNLGASRFLVYTGKISYGLYCFHGIVLTFGAVLLEKTGISLPLAGRIFLFLAVNYLVSAISYRFVEKPFLRLKDRLRRI